MTIAESTSRAGLDLASLSRGALGEGVLSRVGVLSYLCGFVIVASLVLGGGTRGGFLSDAILQLLAIPLLVVALWRLFEIPWTKQMRFALLFCLALVSIPLIQLIPLPPLLWTALPGREPLVETFKILGRDLPWMPISVAPYETWLSALSLIPPLAIFSATLLLPYRDRRFVTWVFLVVGIVSVFLGMAQVAQGSASPWRLFEITNDTEAVGFFANRNHFAALLYSLTLFAAAWAIAATTIGQADARGRFDTIVIVALLGAFTLLVVLLAGQMMARSRMGLGLTIAALFGILALGVSDRRVVSAVTPLRLVVGASILVVIFAAQFALYRVMERFAIDPLEDARLPFGRNTIEAALAYLPFGSGLGTFVPVYAMFEKPADIIANTYANHAHNDFLELWLTTGLAGPVLVAMFIAWLGLRAWEIWRSAPPAEASDLDWDLVRAGTIIVGLLIVHSFVDYPLRTGGIMAVMAFACAVLIEPPLSGEPGPTRARTAKVSEPARQPPVKKTRLPEMAKMAPSGPLIVPQPSAEPAPDLPKKTAPPETPKPATTTLPSVTQTAHSPGSAALSPDRRWGIELDWPDEWSTGSTPSSGQKGPKPPKDS